METKNTNVIIGNGKVVHVGIFLDNGQFSGTTCGVVSYNNCIRNMRSTPSKTNQPVTCKHCLAQLSK
jgi:hypothetical protein